MCLRILNLLSYGFAHWHTSVTRLGALRLAWFLLALEVGGAVLLVVSVAYLEGRRVDRVAAFAVASVVLAVWTLPNAFAFYDVKHRVVPPYSRLRG